MADSYISPTMSLCRPTNGISILGVRQGPNVSVRALYQSHPLFRRPDVHLHHSKR